MWSAVVIAQADGARYARLVDPDAADEALRTISTTARQALGDVRILLAQLRHSEDAAPQPELKELSEVWRRLLEGVGSLLLLLIVFVVLLPHSLETKSSPILLYC